MKKLFTSESVTEGHPDKLCDRISDAVVDEIFKHDPDARCAIECCAGYDRLLIMGEVTSSYTADYETIARNTIKEIGYDFGTFSYDKCNIIIAVHGQSPDIAMGVDSSLENKAPYHFAIAQTGKKANRRKTFGFASLPPSRRQNASYRRIRRKNAQTRGYRCRIGTARRVRYAGTA